MYWSLYQRKKSERWISFLVLTGVPLGRIVDVNFEIRVCRAFSDKGVLELLGVFDWPPGDLVESELRVLLGVLVNRFRFLGYLLKLRHGLRRQLGLHTRHDYDHFTDIAHIARLVAIHEVALLGAHLGHLES